MADPQQRQQQQEPQQWQWHCEPKQWSHSGQTITLTTLPETDFWRKSHYGFIRDNGHFYHTTASGDFTAEVKVTGAYRDMYDQAGLMLRVSEADWVKTGIEFVDGVQQASAVVTREFSDWSIIALPSPPPALWLQVKREGDSIAIFYSTTDPSTAGAPATAVTNAGAAHPQTTEESAAAAGAAAHESETRGGSYVLMRKGYFPPVTGPIQVGVMACSPKGAGYQATFEGFTVHKKA